MGVNFRPYCFEFLNKLNHYYEIFIFTASEKNYAKAIVNKLDPKRDIIKKIFARKDCLRTKNGYFIKDLNMFSNIDLKDVIIVDDTVHSFARNINNGIPILKWLDDKQDQELKYLSQYLIELSSELDVRESLKKRFMLEMLAFTPFDII